MFLLFWLRIKIFLALRLTIRFKKRELFLRLKSISRPKVGFTPKVSREIFI